MPRLLIAFVLATTATAFAADPPSEPKPPLLPTRGSDARGIADLESQARSALRENPAWRSPFLGYLDGKRVKLFFKDAVTFAFSPDGKSVVGSGHTFTAEYPSGRSIQTFEDTGSEFHFKRSVAFTPDGKRVVGVSPGLRVWDVETGKVLLAQDWEWEWKEELKMRTERPGGLLYAKTAAVFDPEVTRAYLGGSSQSEIVSWDLKTGKEIARRDSGVKIESLAVSPDGKLLAVGAVSSFHIWDAATLKEVFSREFRPSGCSGTISFGPDGRLYVIVQARETRRYNDGSTSVSEFPVIDVWNVAAERYLGSIGLNQPPRGPVVVLPGGRYAQIGMNILDLKTLKSPGYVLGDGHVIAAGTPDGKELVSSSGNTLYIHKTDDFLKVIPDDQKP